MLRIIALCLTLAVAGTAASLAQQPGIKRTVLQKADVPGSAFESVLGMAELPAGASIGRHSHPGTEQGTLIEGELALQIEGQPDKTYKAGESWTIPAGVPHDATAGPGGAKVLAVYVVEKGKPLATAVPK